MKTKFKSILTLAILLLFKVMGIAQTPWYLTGNALGASAKLGTTNGYDVLFYANNNQYMDLQYTTGALGIGNTYPPTSQLDVYCGSTTNQNINVSSASNNVGYMIGEQMVLWYNNSMSNIYVGVGAGILSNTGSGNNTALGYDALTNNTGSAANTAIGYEALYYSGGTAGGNTAVGAQALYNNITAGWNTAVGWEALYSNVAGTENTALGVSALSSNTADYNTAVGYQALHSNTSGQSNMAIGWGALSYNNSGNQNTASGQQALYANTGGNNNTADGYEALNGNLIGNNNTAMGMTALLYNTVDNNTAMGFASLYENTTGTLNVAVGVDALYNNQEVSGSTAVGDSTLYSQSGSFPLYNSGDVAVGNSALYSDEIQPSTSGGSFNTVIGEWSMRYNYFGAFNTASGFGTLYSNVSGEENTADGYEALYSGPAGFQNTAMGYKAGYYNIANENTFLGDNAGLGCNNITMSNDAFVGYNSGPGTPGSNTVYLGNTSTTLVGSNNGIFAVWSDRRVKDSIKANVPGLAFINKLQAVTFHYSISKENALMGINDTTNWPTKYDVEKITESGFIAQQVDSAAQACGYNFSGLIKPQGPNDPYKVGYATFVVPLVKAVQELSAKNDTLRTSNDSLRTTVNSLHTTVDSLRSVMQGIQNCLSQLCGTSGSNFDAHSPQSSGSSGSGQNVTLGSADAPLLYQNIPNPFSTGTKINYYLPQGTVGATVVFYDMYGNMLKTVSLSQTGNGTLNITPDNLSNGIYSYSLIVNGSVIDTKKMVLQK